MLLSPDHPNYPMDPGMVAAELAVSRETVLNLMREGELGSFMPGRFMYRTTRAWLNDFKRAHATSEGWPFEPDWSGQLLTIAQVVEAHNAQVTRYPIKASLVESWIRVGVLRAVRVHRMLRLFEETADGMVHGFPAHTTKQRARWARREAK